MSWYSEVPSQIEPIQAPCEPSASDAAIWRPEPMPPAPSTGTSGPTASTMSGCSTIAGDLAGVAAGLVALGHDDVDAVAHVRQRVLGGARERGHLDAVLVALLDDVDRRRAERVGDQHRPVLQGDVEVRARHGVQPAEDALAALALRERRYAELEQRLVDELLVLLGDHRAEVEPTCPRSRIFIGITMSTPYGLPSVLSSSQRQSRLELARCR